MSFFWYDINTTERNETSRTIKNTKTLLNELDFETITKKLKEMVIRPK